MRNAPASRGEIVALRPIIADAPTSRQQYSTNMFYESRQRLNLIDLSDKAIKIIGQSGYKGAAEAAAAASAAA